MSRSRTLQGRPTAPAGGLRHAHRCRLLPVVVLLAMLVAPVWLADGVEAQVRPPTAHLYLVPDLDAGRMTLFDREPTEVANVTVDRWVPAGADDIQVLLPGGRPATWVRSGADQVSVFVPANTSYVDVVSHGVPFAAAGPRLDLQERPLGARIMLHAVVDADRSLRVHGADPTPSYDPDPSDRGLPTDWPAPTGARLAHAGPFESSIERVQIASKDGPAVASTAVLAGGLLVLLTLVTVASFARVHATVGDPTRGRAMPLLGHLEELRNRLFVVLGALMLGSVFFFTFGFQTWHVFGFGVPVPVPSLYGNAAAQVFGWLSLHVVPAGVVVVVVNPWDAVVTQFTLAIAMAVAVTFPVLFYEVYAYLAPGLYPKERRAVLTSVPVVVVLFVLGAAFGIGWMMPFTIRILYGFAGTLHATAFLNVADLVALAAALGLVFGLAFQLPVVMMLTARIGLVSWRTYANKWRHATVAIFIVAALVTDPTVVTQIVVAVVLGLLYAIGILLAWVAERRHRAAQSQGAEGAERA